MRKIFVSYRREPDQYVAGNLSRELRRLFGDSQVFRDKESIEGGVSWKQHVLDEIDRDSVLLVLIGQKWGDVRDAGGNRRLDKPDDPIRLEIADAMRDGAAIIPLLLENAQIPLASELPQELIQLAELNALKLRDGDWEADVAKIVQRLEKLGAKRVAGADSQPGNVDGQALDTMINSRGSLPQKEVLAIFRGVLEGLGFAHRKGVIHRGVKPSNILVDQSGKARITDFGIAILAGSQRLTATGLTVGTAWYMSPEQIRQPRSIDHRSDIYSAGIVLYEMLTGAVPFDGDTDFSVKEQQINSAPPDPRAKNPAISPTLSQIVQKAMAKEPDRRFQNCGEFLASIDAYQAEASGRQVAPAKWGIAAALAGLMIAVGAGIHFSKPVRFVVDEEAMLQKEHETGFILIQGAAEKASLACRELREIDLKRQNLEIAKGLGDTGLVDAYTTQIEEIAQNIRDHASEHKDLIGRLVGIKKPVAEAEFEHYANELLGKKSFDQVHVSRLVQRHYQNHLDGANAEHVGLTRETCIEE